MQGKEKQKSGARRKSRHASLQNALPGQAIGDMSSEKEQANTRKKLRQTHQAEVQRPVGNFVHLPSDRHRLHLGGRGAEQTSTQVVAKICIVESGAGGRLA
jgi:hypothetical protein